MDEEENVDPAVEEEVADTPDEPEAVEDAAEEPAEENPEEETEEAEEGAVDEENPVEDGEGEVQEGETPPNEEGEQEADNPDAEAAPEDVELEIRDEDEGRPDSSRSKKSVTFSDPPSDAPAVASGPNPLFKLVRGMWASREMLQEDCDAQIVMKTTLRELIVYRYCCCMNIENYNPKVCRDCV